MYAELHARVDDVALRLATLGVRSGDRVGVLLWNGVPFAEVVHACMRLGAVLLPLNLRLTPRELAWQVGDAGARVVLCDASTEAKAAELRAQAEELVVARVDGAARADIRPSTSTPLRDRTDPLTWPSEAEIEDYYRECQARGLAK